MVTPIATSRANSALKRWLRRIAIFCLATVLLALNLELIFTLVFIPRPPSLTGVAHITAEKVTHKDGIQRLGPCWRRDHRGQHVLYLQGDSYALGYCNSRLNGDVLPKQEDALQVALDRFVPSSFLQTLLMRGLVVAYHNLPENIPLVQQLEIRGLADGYHDPNKNKAPTYGRLMYYHAIHDIGQMLVDNPMFACSSFAVSGMQTADKHTLLARVFDFEGGEVFDRDKFVIFVKPHYGIPFVSVAWAGMAGVVSGINQAGIGVVLNAVGSDDKTFTGTPTTLIVREVLQNAQSLSDVVALLKRARPLISDILTVGDGKTGEVMVIEWTPEKMAIRKTDDLGSIAATNHFLHPMFKNDQENAKRIEKGTTQRRYRRLTELLTENRHATGQIDPTVAMNILRDKRESANSSPATGNRNTIDAWIATHAVIFDLTARRIWVSKGPHTLGEFVAYDLNEVFSGVFRDHGSLAEDPLLRDGTWDKFRTARQTGPSQ